jgi:hypothetical protein
VRISFALPVKGASESNLVETAGAEISAADGLRFDLRPYEIKTFRLQVGDTSGVKRASAR